MNFLKSFKYFLSAFCREEVIMGRSRPKGNEFRNIHGRSQYENEINL
jgi:hypothetical protein